MFPHLFSAVIFDFFNTLTTAVNRGPAHAYVARLLGCDPRDWLAGLDRTFRQRCEGRYGTAMEGLRRLAGELGARPTSAQLFAAIEARVGAVKADAPLRADAVPVLQTLRAAGIATAVLSDCWFELPQFLPRLPIAPLLSGAAYSIAVGRRKPHPSMYLAACNVLDVDPRDCLYVGDGGSHELIGAQMLGMNAVRMAAPDLGGHLTFDDDPGWDGPTVGSLTEVVRMLRRPVGPVRDLVPA